MKRSLLLITLLISGVIYAQNAADLPKLWKFKGIGSLTLNQANFTNWSAGGENSLSGTALLKLYADYTKENFSINNNANFKYGILSNDLYDKPIKNEDLIELNSQFNYKISKQWSVSGLINLTTQFTNGYNYPDDSTIISKFFAPAYLTVAPGMLYKPAEYFSILMTPITLRNIFVLDQELADLGAFGVDKADTLTDGSIDKGTGKKTKLKLGAFVEFYFKDEIRTDMTFESKMNFFYNYLDDKNIYNGKLKLDFQWQTFINYSINNWLAANFFVHFAYMPGDVFIERTGVDGKKFSVKPNDKMQIKQTFGIGLSYNF
ncbi:MAG: DUF3078 domain-containing protein [Bacteroidales bacterium]|nr:DUF3078 domain-containing protein [Bacteroidales bacterium]